MTTPPPPPSERFVKALEDRYRIDDALGEGGMATVYRAQDLKHDRWVAIKVLKPELSAVIGAERFLAEIKTTANLQHPHILPLFDSGEAEGLLFYVMPLVDGESLRDRIDRDKQLPVDEAVRIASAVAGALDYAHRQGVIHRDIKPANILLHDGQPVVADFGIALAVSAAGGGRLTETGLSLGTPHYMSPEQATADRDLSPQSDIYALASVTYEMLSGAAPFTAPTAQAVLMKILTEDAPPVSGIRKSVPEHVDAALARALEKLPADRFASAEEFGQALRDPAATQLWRETRSGRTPGVATERAAYGRRGWPLAAAVMTVVAVLGWMDGGRAERTVTRLLLPTTDDVGGESAPPNYLTVSPDGRSVVYMREEGGGNLAGFRRDLGSDQVRRVFDRQFVDAAFSPSGEQLAINDGASLRLVGRDGGGSSLLATGVEASSHVRWSSDDWVYYTASDGSLLRTRPDGGDPERIALAEGVGPLFMLVPLPESNAGIVFHAPDESIGFLQFDSGRYRRLHSGVMAWLLDDRYLVWSAGGGVLAQRFDPATGAVSGPAVDVFEGGRVSERQGLPLMTVSLSGTLVYVPTRPDANDNLVSVSRGGSRVQLDVRVGSDLGLTVSPTGDRVAFEERPVDRGDVYVADLETGLRTRLTFDSDAVYPTWTPDGERVAYYRLVDGEYGLYWRPADGSGVEEVLLDGPGREIEVRFFPDGERILVRQGDRSAADGTDLYEYRVGDPESGRPIADGPGNEVAPRLSPDGRYVAYASDELGGASHVFVRSIDDPRERWQISEAEGGAEPTWSADGTELFYRGSGFLMAAPVEIRPSFRRLGEAIELFSTSGLLANSNHTGYDLRPDGTFLFIAARQGTDTRIVLDWTEVLEERLGGR